MGLEWHRHHEEALKTPIKSQMVPEILNNNYASTCLLKFVSAYEKRLDLAAYSGATPCEDVEVTNARQM